MRSAIATALCLLAAVPVAHAGGFTAATVSGQAAADQGTTTSTNSSTFGQGNAAGSSASGTNFTMGGGNGSGASFTSNGSAQSNTTVTPFSVTTTSSHTAFASGYATPGAGFSASNQTFGQSNGSSAFQSQQTTSHNTWNTAGFSINAQAGFAVGTGF